MSRESQPNHDELRARIAALEARVARLEAERLTKPPTTERAAPPTPTLRAPSPGLGPRAPVTPPIKLRQRKRRQPEAAVDYERLVGLTVLGWVGVAAVVVAAAYFGQLGWARLGPGARTIVVYLLGAGLISAGAVLRHRVVTRYIALLWGAGTALTYLAGTLAYLRYDVISSPVAVAALLGSSALGQYLAWRLRDQVMATVALALAYAAPVLVGAPSPTPTAFFALLLALHTWGSWTEHRFGWRAARALSVAATTALVIGWYLDRGPGSATSFGIHIAVVWLLLAGPELLRVAASRDVGTLRAALLFAGGIVATLAILSRPDTARWFGLPAAGAWLLLGGSLAQRDINTGAWLARVGSLVLPIGVARWLVPGLGTGERAQELAYLAALPAAALLLFVVRRWTRVAEQGAAVAGALTIIGAFAIENLTTVAALLQWPLTVAPPLLLLVLGHSPVAWLAGLGIGALASGSWFVVVFAGPDAMALAVSSTALLAAFATTLGARRRSRLLTNASTVVFVLLLVMWTLHFVEQLIRPASDPLLASGATLLWNARFGAIALLVALTVAARRSLANDNKIERTALGVVALVGTYVAGLFELLDFVAPWSFGPRAVATSLYSLAFALAVSVAGFRTQNAALRWAALVAFGGIALKVAVHDLSQVDTPIRVLVSGVLGGVLLLVAWGYARSQRPAE
ncbi:MAG: DUF2339 domain-containing protein [Planctomycetota bacterium]